MGCSSIPFLAFTSGTLAVVVAANLVWAFVSSAYVPLGDSLTRISTRYYGTASRWQEIYDANRETLKGENALRPGQSLRIP